MSYIPVGTLLTYTATIITYLQKGYTSWSQLAAALSQDLRTNLPGLEEFDVESSNGSNNYTQFTFNISLQVLNNGVDHGDENDVKSIIDGTIQGYGNSIQSSSITQIKLPNNPEDDTSGQVINTGANSNAPPPTNTTATPSTGSGLASLFNFGTSTKLLTSGTIIIIVIILLVFLLPKSVLTLAGRG